MPMTSVKCSAARNMSAADKVISFPILGSSESFEKTILNSQDFDSKPSQHLQFRWVSLPEQGRSFSTGAIFQSPWTSNNQSRIVVGCAVQAQWIPAEIHSDGYSFWQGWYPKELKWADAYPYSGQPMFNGSTAPDDMKAIATDVGWLNMLTPPIGQGQPGYQDWAPTTIEGVLAYSHILDGIFDSDGRSPIDVWRFEEQLRSHLLISIIGSVFNDGLARVGIEDAFDQEGAPSNWKSTAPTTTNTTTGNTTELKVKFTIGGLSYRLTIVQKLAAAVLLLHVLIALVHSVWLILWTGESSGCWDSVTELVVLA
ncbi:MAG: hypothetical protein Q9210_000762 [Variospora velana]